MERVASHEPYIAVQKLSKIVFAQAVSYEMEIDMKTLIFMAAAIIGLQAHGGMIVCMNEADGEVTDFLRIEGLLDDNGDLAVRPDKDSMITFVSPRNQLDLCKGFNLDPNKDLVPMGQYWKVEKLMSAGLRVRLNRAENGVITAKAADASTGVEFSNCHYIFEAGDSEAVQAKAQALEDIADDPEMKELELKQVDEATAVPPK